MRKIFYGIATIGLMACGGTDEPKAMQNIKTDITESEEADLAVTKRQLQELKTASKVVYTLPSPVEMADILHQTQAVYDVGILNNPNSIDNYITDYKRALNLGVYFADLSFTSMFDYPQDAMKFMGAAQALSDELNIQGVFTDDLMMRLEENINNKDSLMDIVANAYMDTDMYLQDNERPIIAKAILTGAWLEGLYIAVNLKTEEEKADKIWKKVGEQKPALNNLSKMVKDCNDERFAAMSTELDELITTYNDVKLNYEKGTNSTDTEKKTTTIGSRLNVVITDETFSKIKTQTTAIRSNIVK